MSKKSFYITTAIDYPNGTPHMGHAYEKVIADAYARWYRLLERDVYFLTGTDENGQKLIKAAQEAKQETGKYVDSQVEHFRELCKNLEISNDDFIRTTEKRHADVASELWKRCEAKGDIYLGQYEGLYCLACEAFYTELQTPDKKCPNHGTALELVKEDGYFFKLSAYADWIRKHFDANPQFVAPQSARNEMLRRMEAEPIRDLSVSRPNAGWGIPVPSNPKYVMYTWFDALINYLSAVRGTDKEKRFWPAQMHVIGKDITWFHSVIWPAMLKSADLPIPEQIYVHGMVLGEDGKKMSKSLGNGVDPKTIIEKFPIDSFRYYLLRAIPSGLDGAFVTADLMSRHNNELANDLGNLLSRVVKLAMKKLGEKVDSAGIEPKFDFVALGKEMEAAMDAREHHRALEIMWVKINDVNLYITREEPWKKDATELHVKTVLVNALYGLKAFAILTTPFLPQISKQMKDILGAEDTSYAALRFQGSTFQLKDPPPLFPKMEIPK